MKFLRDNWFYVGGIIFAMLAFIMPFAHGYLNTLQLVLMCNFMALLLHQFEEYVLPGGAPIVINIGFKGEKENYLRYPGNTQIAMLVNMFAWIPYVLAVYFDEWIWLGLGTMFFSLSQIWGHSIQMNKAMNTWYNAGLATAVFLFLPIGVVYMWMIIQTGTDIWDWLGGIVAFVVITVVLLIVPYLLFQDKNSPYVIPEWQVERYKKVKTFASFKSQSVKSE